MEMGQSTRVVWLLRIDVLRFIGRRETFFTRPAFLALFLWLHHICEVVRVFDMGFYRLMYMSAQPGGSPVKDEG